MAVPLQRFAGSLSSSVASPRGIDDVTPVLPRNSRLADRIPQRCATRPSCSLASAPGPRGLLFPRTQQQETHSCLGRAISGTRRVGRWQELSRQSAPERGGRCRAEAEGSNGAASPTGGSAGAAQGPSGSHMLKCITEGAEVSVSVLVGTELVQEAQRRHSLAPTAAAALGRLLMGTLLLAAKQGPGEVVQVTVSGRGPIGQLTALASDPSHVKGFVGDPSCDPPLNARGKLNVGAAVGAGVVTVTRTHPSWQQAYTGTVPIQTGEIAEDLAHYLAESEQVKSAIGLGVAVGRDGGVLAAGGFLVQVLPFCSEETLQMLEQNVSSMPAVSDLVKRGEDAEAIAGRLLQGMGWRRAGDEVDAHYGPCGADALRPRMLRAVVALGDTEVDALLQEQGSVEVKCEFCAETIQFSEEEVHAALEEDKAMT